MSTISKAAVVLLVNSTELDICLPLKTKTDEQAQNTAQTLRKQLAPPPSSDNSLINRISKLQINKITDAPAESLVIAAKSAVQKDKKLLELYEYEPFVESNQLMIVDKIKEEEKVEEPVGSYILINKTARKIGIRNKFKRGFIREFQTLPITCSSLLI